jgi:hypothetical protein
MAKVANGSIGHQQLAMKNVEYQDSVSVNLHENQEVVRKKMAVKIHHAQEHCNCLIS